MFRSGFWELDVEDHARAVATRDCRQVPLGYMNFQGTGVLRS